MALVAGLVGGVASAAIGRFTVVSVAGLVVIGAGMAGSAASNKCASEGWKVAVDERVKAVLDRSALAIVPGVRTPVFAGLLGWLLLCGPRSRRFRAMERVVSPAAWTIGAGQIARLGGGCNHSTD